MGAIASLVLAFSAPPASLALLSYSALYAGCAYGCKKGFKRAGQMRKEGWTGKREHDGSRISSAGGSKRGPGKGVEVIREKLEQDGRVKSVLKMAVGTVGAVVSVAGPSLWVRLLRGFIIDYSLTKKRMLFHLYVWELLVNH
jgi:hypothetical protein